MAARAGRFFFMSEFDCHDGTRVPARAHGEVMILVRGYLDPLRAEFGPVTVHSGFRTKVHNKSVGHVYSLQPGRGVAADVSCRVGRPRDWAEFLERLHPGGLGRYENFVHVDTRDGHARWGA
jgi:uncharacterized protein YcbK (DUF882 family)